MMTVTRQHHRSGRAAARRRVGGGGAVAVVLVLAACGSSGGGHASSTSTTSRRAHPSTSTTTVTTRPSAGDAVLAPPLLPLFPYQTTAEADAWRHDHQASGARPEFADAGQTALAFARFLGYTEVDRIIATRQDAEGVHVAVGSLVPDTSTATTAAVVHLVRFTAGSDAPWEVVGTDDTTFAITTPGYGSSIRSPLAVAGRITGVDESIRVHVQQLHANGFLGELCCVPAGGNDSPWSGTVTFSPPTDPILIVSASTGGHTRNVERFTVNGVRAG